MDYPERKLMFLSNGYLGDDDRVSITIVEEFEVKIFQFSPKTS